MEGKGTFPDLEYNFDQTSLLPIFTRPPNGLHKSAVKGLIGANTQAKIMKALKDTLGDTPLSFPSNSTILGLRADPCQKSDCENEVRLISEDPILEDRSAHLIYRLSKTDFYQFLNEVKHLNQSCEKITPQLELSVHPCADDQMFVKKLNGVIKKYCIDKFLKKVAFQIRTSDTFDGAVFWIFAAVQKVGDKWIPLTTQSAPSGVEFFGFGKGKSDMAGVVLNGVDALVVEGLNRQLDVQQTQKLVVELENPKITNVHNTSCMSCHASPGLRSRFETLKTDLNYFAVNSYEANESNSPGQADIRHFGYRFGQVKISERVKNEVRLILKFLNLDNDK